MKGGGMWMIKAGIYGASGYMGSEALRVLLKHPEVSVQWATSRSDTPIEYYHRNFVGSGVRFVSPDEIGRGDTAPCDVVFFALPTGLTTEICRPFYRAGCKIIDFGADFRLKDQAVWERVYRQKHPDWSLVQQAVYGINELHREDVVHGEIIANPGCYSSSAILALAPLISNRLIARRNIVVDGLSGTVGAGDELDPALHHPEMTNNLLPYNVVDHRHSYEIEQELSGLAGEAITVHFSTCYVPVSRGILTISHCFPIQKTNRNELLALYKEFYKDAYFVKIIDIPKDERSSFNYLPYPWIAAVSATNFCHIGLDVDERRGRIVVYSVLDSIGKGGAQVGVQNMNLMFGQEETLGLDCFGIHPY
jgi:N-acetyl-gamma-glutamyl-phosphate reductase common form